MPGAMKVLRFKSFGGIDGANTNTDDSGMGRTGEGVGQSTMTPARITLVSVTPPLCSDTYLLVRPNPSNQYLLVNSLKLVRLLSQAREFGFRSIDPSVKQTIK